MLAPDAEDRITVEEALAHRWIAERDVYAPKIHLQVRTGALITICNEFGLESFGCMRFSQIFTDFFHFGTFFSKIKPKKL